MDRLCHVIGRCRYIYFWGGAGRLCLSRTSSGANIWVKDQALNTYAFQDYVHTYERDPPLTHSDSV